MITIRDLSFFYDSKQIFYNLNLDINPGQRYAIIGENGSGKSTLLKILTGEIPYNLGTVDLHGQKVLAYPQTLDKWINNTVLEFALDISGIKKTQLEFEEALNNFDKDPESYQDKLEKLELSGAYSIESVLALNLEKVGLKIDLNHAIAKLSGGQRSKVCLAVFFSVTSDIYIFDEPTNNLDLAGVKLLEDFILTNTKTILLVSHDRQLIRKTANRIIEIDKNTLQAKLYNLNLDNYLREIEVQKNKQRLAYKQYIEEQERLQEASRVADQKASAFETEAETRDNDKMAKTKRMEKAGTSLARQSKAIKRRLERIEEIEKLKQYDTVELNFSIADNISDQILICKDLVFGYPNRQFGPINLEVIRSQRIVITGTNGIGKSTLIKAILNNKLIISGTITLADNLTIGFLDQDQSTLPSGKSVLEAFLELTGTDNNKAYHALSKVGIQDEGVELLTDSLSPGQKMRCVLASFAVLKTGLLILDEPTNHIDLDTAKELEDSINSYQGSIIVITHDREFINNINPTMVYEFDGKQLTQVTI